MKIILACLTVLCFCFLAHAGGLSRVGADLGINSDPHGVLFPENVASQIQRGDGSSADIGLEIMKPSFTYTNRLGKKFTSQKNLVHPLPLLSYSERLTDNLVWGVDIKTDYGIGASFDDIMYGISSETLVSCTNVKPYLTLRLTHELSIGAGPVFGLAMIEWSGPFDIGRKLYLPIRAGIRGWGMGVGGHVGVFWKYKKIAIGANYLTSLTADIDARAKIGIGPVMLHDRTDFKFEYRDKLDLTLDYQPTPDWSLATQVTYYGYSHNTMDQVSVKFRHLPITKPLDLSWQDNLALYFCASRYVGEHWLVGGGIAYMTKAIDKTADFYSPDVSGFSYGVRLGYQSDDFNLSLALSQGGGKNESRGTKMTADIWTLGFSGTIKF
jgi:long-subunit fatty acid transport protein